jgi:hypothetical protein
VQNCSFCAKQSYAPTALVGERADVRKWPTPDGTLLDHSVIIQPTKNGAPVETPLNLLIRDVPN